MRLVPDPAPLRTALQAVVRELDSIHAEETSPDGLVTATVDGRGRLVELYLDTRVFRTTDSRALAAAILDTVRRAAGTAADHAGQALRKELR
ncbi:MAG TPA: YbaB/EbfC family nucleoid-associated protein [Actinophytocola sp.]|nr:YbaB/EbfC family nucleoid-associated protein [Actinophytocola sp.]